MKERSCPRLLCEQLSYIFEGLKFQGIAGGIEKEHRGLFAVLALETDVRFNDKFYALPGESSGERLPVMPFQYHPVVRKRHFATVDAVPRLAAVSTVHAGLQMNYELMAVEVKIHPGCGGAPFRESHDVSIKAAAGLEVMDGDGEMKGH
jgi:hypothetical protein